MYQHVAHRISFQHLEAMFEDCFGLRVSFVELHMLKSLVARRYRATWKRILGPINLAPREPRLGLWRGNAAGSTNPRRARHQVDWRHAGAARPVPASSLAVAASPGSAGYGLSRRAR